MHEEKNNLYAELFSSSFQMFKKVCFEGIVCSRPFLLTRDEEVSEEDATTVWEHIPVSDPDASK